MLFETISRVATIGHRPDRYMVKKGKERLPKNIVALQKETSSILNDCGVITVHGNAEGSDRNWSHSVLPERQEVYIPGGYIPEWAMDLVVKYHPMPDRLSYWAWRLHARNFMIITGMENNDPVDMVFAHTYDGQCVGGTATALKYAYSLGIPVLNTGFVEDRLYLESQIKLYRQELEIRPRNF